MTAIDTPTPSTPDESPVDRAKRLEASVADLSSRYNALVTEHNGLISRSGTLTDGQETRLRDVARAMEKTQAEISTAERELDGARFEVRRSRDLDRIDTMLGGAAAEAGNPFDVAGGRGRVWRNVDRAAIWDADISRMGVAGIIDQANRAVDATFSRRLDRVPTSAFDKVAAMLGGSDAGEVHRAAQWALVASDPAYESAFAKLVIDPTRGHLEWDDTERRAYGRVQTVARAMSLTDANGGYMVPFTLDPAILLTNDGSNNPLRQLATVKQITTDTWNGITSAGATSEWKSEAAEVADGSPTLAQPSIPTFFGDSFVPYSFEFGMDAGDAMSELTRILLDSADNLMATAYTTGNGSSAPQGIVTGLVGGSSEINTTGSETYDDSDPFALQNALPARFSANATFQAHIATMNAYRQMETTNGALMFPELRQNPPYLLGKRFYENSNMDGSINAAATANNYVMVYGDVRAGYYIVDRIGATLELIPNLVGANQRPTGQRGAFLWFRTGAEVVVPQALRLLDIPTAA